MGFWGGSGGFWGCSRVVLAASLSFQLFWQPFSAEPTAALFLTPFVDEAATASITASTRPISCLCGSSPAPSPSPSPHINSSRSLLTGPSLNRIKDFPHYYKRETTSAASPRPPPPLMAALWRASSCGLELPLFINACEKSSASLSGVMRSSPQRRRPPLTRRQLR